MTGGHLAPADERVGNRKPLIYTTAPPLDSTILRRAGRLVFHAPRVVWNFFRPRLCSGASKKSIGGPSGNARIVEAFVAPPPG